MKISKLFNNLSPICFLPSGELICYKYGLIYILMDDVVVKKIRIISGFKERFLGRFKCLRRLLRIGIRSAIAIDNHSIIISVGCKLYELSLDTGQLSKGFSLRSGVRPLIFSEIKGITGFKDSIYFGEYNTDNFEKNEIAIYKRVAIDNWKKVYTFPKGTVNHIHNIIADKFRDCVWIFTGDFDDAAAIWRCDNGFSNLNRVYCGDQRYRGCIAFALKDGIVYATDTPYSQNYVYQVTDDGKILTLKEISGSCIYGCRCNDNIYFSTTVEPDGRNQTLLRLLFDYKIGAGIKDRYARIYELNELGKIEEIYKAKKDFLPFIFQFGAFKFPNGNNHSRNLYFEPVALKNIDLCLAEINLSR